MKTVIRSFLLFTPLRGSVRVGHSMFFSGVKDSIQIHIVLQFACSNSTWATDMLDTQPSHFNLLTCGDFPSVAQIVSVCV